MSSYHRRTLIVVIISLFICYAHNQSQCATSSAGIGCTACNSSFVLAYNQSSALYTCIGVANCSVVSGSLCVKCQGPSYVYNNVCYNNFEGCINGNNTYCLQCDTGYVLLTNGTCFKKSIPFCSVYNQAQCVKCQYSLMDSAANCSINTSICLSFDYSIMKCTKCGINQIIKSDGMGCNTIVDNCQVYDNGYTGLCLLCKQNYMYNDSSKTCVDTQAVGINQQMIIYNYSASTYVYQYTCLNNLQGYVGGACVATSSSTIKHCKTINGTNCSQCLNGYYLSNSNYCTECDIKISNCALCSSATYCTQCRYGYYKLIIDNTTTKCMPCSSYNCLHCSTSFNGNNQVQCLSCPTNYTLYAGTCFNCQSKLYAYSIMQSKCLSCNQSLINCRFCKFTGDITQSIICLECVENYYYNQLNKSCELITNITSTTNITKSIFEILKKLGPGIQVPLYNNRSGLMSICNQTDGYVCICSDVSANLTSFCSNFSVYNTTDIIIASIIPNINDLVTKSPNQYRMLAQFPSYPSTTLPLTNQVYSQYQFWNILSAYTYMQQRGSNIAIAQILDQHVAVMGSVFSDQKITILRGNGFYYKYIPTGLKSGGPGDDDYIYTSLGSNSAVSFYVFFSRYNISGLISGTIYVITNNNTNFTLHVRKTRHFDDQTNLTVKLSGVVDKNLNASLNTGILVITNVTRSKSVEVYSSSATTQEDTYQYQRIQNIFYSQSWLYILFFIVLYLIFIPLCAIIDCCQSEQYTRKKVGEQQPSDKSEETTIIRINYRQFFPLYNVGNTPRPRRLTKVCLFIVNMQHIITFLTLVYFNLPENTPVGAIALVVPAYIMVVIMGYICGAIFRKLRGHFKYLINLFSFGYWFLWFFLMRIMAGKSSQYRLYILVFAIICFFLDLVIDALETLLVYFAIKQGQSQVNLFNCLARWLSYRGFYQFDKLAKEIQGQNQ